MRQASHAPQTLMVTFQRQAGTFLFFQKKVRENTCNTLLYTLNYTSRSPVLKEDLQLCPTEFNSRYMHLSTEKGENFPCFKGRLILWYLIKQATVSNQRSLALTVLLRRDCRPSLSVISLIAMAFGRSCLFANSSSTASRSSSSWSWEKTNSHVTALAQLTTSTKET